MIGRPVRIVEPHLVGQLINALLQCIGIGY